MSSDLSDLTALADGDSDTFIEIIRVECERSEARVTVSLDFFDEFENIRRGRYLHCEGVYSWMFTSKEPAVISLEVDHPALLPYLENSAELFFKGRPTNSSALANELRAEHAQAVSNFLEFSDVVNDSPDAPLSELLSGGYGRLASGPLSLVERYDAIAREHGLSTSLIDHGGPKRYDETAEVWEEIQTPPKLLWLGSSYIIGDAFTAEDRVAS